MPALGGAARFLASMASAQGRSAADAHRSQHSRDAEEQAPLADALCDRKQRGSRRIDTVLCGGRIGARSEDLMLLLIVGAVIVLIAVVLILRTRSPGRVSAGTLGWMSER